MKSIKIILFLLIVGALKIYAQSDIVLKIEDMKMNCDSLFLQFSISNNGKRLVKLYKPERQDICYSVVKVLLTDKANRKYQITPCNEIIDLDAIILSSKNSIYLSKDECFMKKIGFSLKDVVPFLTKNEDYYTVMEINLKDVSFKGETDDLAKCNLKSSNKIKVGLTFPSLERK
jgi:hypothetical protein